MKKYLLAALMSVAAWPALAALQAGDTAPDFNAEASYAGKPFRLSLRDTLKKGPVVVYFYPSAYTNGCNVQAHAFAVNNEQFAAAGATIVGVSLDNIKRLNDFSADPDYCAGKFATVADADGNIAKSYALNIRAAREGAKDSRGLDIDHAYAERTTFVITPDGKIAATIGGLTPAENVDKTLEFVRQLHATKTK